MFYLTQLTLIKLSIEGFMIYLKRLAKFKRASRILYCFSGYEDYFSL